MIRRGLLFLLLCGVAFTAHAEKFYGRVIVVIDGDTVLVLKHGHPLKVRLADIDAPEVAHGGKGGQPPSSQKSQDYGAASTDALKRLVLHKMVEVDALGIGKYGRTIALLKVGSLNVNEQMVRSGMAWEYSHFHRNRRYIALQHEAQQARRGLWQQPDPTPPWQWRRQHKEQPAVLPVLKPGDYTCGSKHRCSRMRSCNEAHYYLTVCGVKALNPKGDGVPCKSLCLRGR